MEINGYIEISGPGGVSLFVPDGSILDVIAEALMALETGPNLGLLVHGNQGEAHYSELMRSLRGLDALVMCAVADKDLTAPPGSPADGDRYIVASGASGAWSGKDGQITRYSTKAAAWEFYDPSAGWLLFVVDEAKWYYHTGSAWAELETGGAGGAGGASVLEVQMFS